MRTVVLCVLAALLVCGIIVIPAVADWAPGDGHKMHFPQLPDEAGWDVNSTYPSVSADDWMCSETGWVKDIHFWGSWKDGITGQIQGFKISIHADIPADQNPDGYSKPGEVLWQQTITDFIAVEINPPTLEGWYDPNSGEVLGNNHQQYFQYNIDLPEQQWFWQDEGTIYWLSISAIVPDPVTQWGWKSSLEHWNDDAVFGTAADCVAPDNGTGTVTLPPSCPYVSQPEPFQVIDGLPPGTTIDIDVRIDDYTEQNEYSGGSLGGTIVEFNAVMAMNMTGTGDLTGFNRSIEMPIFMEYHTAPRNPGDPVQTFATDIWTMTGSVLGDPDFSTFQITAGSSESVPCPGQLVLTRLPTGDFQVDSFFDITYRIDFEGAPGSALEGFAGSTTATDRVVLTGSSRAVWSELYEPDPPPVTNAWGVVVDPTGTVINGFGEDAYGLGWYYYDSEWWNIWFYDHPLKYTRMKTIHIEFDAFKYNQAEPTQLILAANWATDLWSIDGNPLPDPRIPPLPGVDEALYIGRQILIDIPEPNGHYFFDYDIPDYNPEWVSIDIQGFNFQIDNGLIIHECARIGDRESMDLAFVITGGPPAVEEACCLQDGTCIMANPADCIGLGGNPQGPGTICTAVMACCMPDGSCVMADPLCCTDMGGNPQAAGTVCTALEACCLSDGSCIMADPLCCTDMGGTPQGTGTVCTGQTVACCLPDGSCMDIEEICCNAMGGTASPLGAASCLGDSDGDGNDDACVEPNVDTCSYYKARYPDYAPYSIPDFDQKQNGWMGVTGTWSYCGPAALANCFWWFDSKFETAPMVPPAISDTYPLVDDILLAGIDDHDVNNVIPLINALAVSLNCSPATNGTYILDFINGASNWITGKGLGSQYTVTPVQDPPYELIRDEVLRSQNVILLLGFYETFGPDVECNRLGGHYVTVAGVCEENEEWKLCISDPWYDHLEGEPPAGTAHASNVHNDAAMISGPHGTIHHDLYHVGLNIPPACITPLQPVIELLDYPDLPMDIMNFFDLNPTEPMIQPQPYQGGDIRTLVDWAVIICPVEDTCAQQFPGDVNDDGLIDINDPVYMINWFFAGGAPPAIMANADPNGDCCIDGLDILYLNKFVFSGGPAPVNCTCVNPQVCMNLIGDANGDLDLNVGDAVYIINYIFKGGAAPKPYALSSGDANCDCVVNVGDAVYLINYIFKGGAAPCNCCDWLVNCGNPLRQ